jgi:hypothetical protein
MQLLVVGASMFWNLDEDWSRGQKGVVGSLQTAILENRMTTRECRMTAVPGRLGGLAALNPAVQSAQQFNRRSSSIDAAVQSTQQFNRRSSSIDAAVQSTKQSQLSCGTCEITCDFPKSPSDQGQPEAVGPKRGSFRGTVNWPQDGGLCHTHPTPPSRPIPSLASA